MKKIFFIFVLALSLFSCATFNMQDPAYRLSVGFATGKVIENGDTKARAEKVISYAQQAKKFIDFDSFTVDQIKDKLKERVLLEGLSQADTFLAISLIDMVQVNVRKDIEKGLIDPDTKVTLNEILNTIISVAEMYL